MKPEEFAEQFGMTTQQLFQKAHERFGLVFGTAGPLADHAWWRKWGTVPIYVKKYIAFERRKLAPTIEGSAT